MFRLHSLHIFQHFLYIIHTSQTHIYTHAHSTHTCTHTHVFCQHFREMGSHENWERETEIKIGVWQAKEKTLPDPPPPPPSPPTPAHCGGPCRSADRRTHMCRRGKEKEREDSGGSGNAANIFGATARTRSSNRCRCRCHCHRRRCQRQRRRCYFVSVVSTVDTKSKKHFTTMSILNMATLHCTHTHTSTHARTRTSHPRAALQTMRRRKCE